MRDGISDDGAGEFVDVGGEDVGFFDDWEEGLPLALWMSSRHFLTISLARRATSGFLCCLDLLTTTPILVERRRSSEATTPVLSSFNIPMMAAGGSPATVAFCNALDFSTISLGSILRG